MLRVTPSNVLIVPPFECAWLSDEKLQLKDGSGCLDVCVKGENDVTIILKSMPGSKRWQHGSNYTVILGSHRNSCLKFERDGLLCQRVENVPGARVSKDDFTRFWINCAGGTISVGMGEPGTAPWHTWTDVEPLRDVQHVGLSAWDHHVAYRDIQMHAPIALDDNATPKAGPLEPAVQSVLPLESLCCSAVRQSLSPASVCPALQLTECLAPALDVLQASLVSYLAENLDATLSSAPESFSCLPPSVLGLLLKNPNLGNEKRAFDAVMEWAGAPGAERRTSDVEPLLPLIRFPLMTPSDLQAVREHPLTADSTVLQTLLDEAMGAGPGNPSGKTLYPSLSVEAKRHVRAAERDDSDAAVRFRRRQLPTCVELMYGWDGDRNGVVHHFGCGLGKQPWVNPVRAGRLTVKASSPACRHTDPRALVSGSFLRANWAGPARAGGRGGGPARAPATWWLLDLGPAHRLLPNYYTLRHDGSPDYLRSWALQGSNDGEAWVDLRLHTNDGTLRMAGQYASWPVPDTAAVTAFRMFRILLLGPTAAPGPRKDTIALSGWELYGFLTPA